MTLLLVAHDGEWTRRRVPSVKWAHEFANQHRVPSYDAAVVGVPQRMRDYNRRKKAEGHLSRPAATPQRPSTGRTPPACVTPKPVAPEGTWP